MGNSVISQEMYTYARTRRYSAYINASIGIGSDLLNATRKPANDDNDVAGILRVHPFYYGDIYVGKGDRPDRPGKPGFIAV